MTPGQLKLYRGQWGKVRKVLVEMAGMSVNEAEAERHEIHRQALGLDKSSKAFTQREFDKVLAAFDSYLVLQDGPSTKPSREAAQPVARLIWSIEQTGLGDHYVAAISKDKFGTAEWRSLGENRLRFLCWTCQARARKKSAP